ncbi:methyltransferase domain-containing protein [Flavobacterium okayamense]|uniref:SAM-dependent methyltransferase n=1 Tax=Flavobacterium okayamense TaxID=2830782 RepID=A0ABM7SFV3_9FLAO|nr:methyltransferase domain-containing protein [Flavobacterium okayamense]BCY29632.1 SAM-dependent methyltransferase [Flavobacterium okayamense]
MANLNKDFWENRYISNEIGWDVGEITIPLKEYIDQIENKDLKILIPGAGNGYEFDYLISNGFKNVWVVDIAKQPLENLASRNPEFKNNFIQSDFFELNNEFDLIIEQTFFCALEPNLRSKYVDKMYSLLSKKGKIFGLLFDFELTEVGPPFGGCKEEYIELFTEKFNLKVLERAYNSIKPREGRELFFIFEKK